MEATLEFGPISHIVQINMIFSKGAISSWTSKIICTARYKNSRSDRTKTKILVLQLEILLKILHDWILEQTIRHWWREFNNKKLNFGCQTTVRNFEIVFPQHQMTHQLLNCSEHLIFSPNEREFSPYLQARHI